MKTLKDFTELRLKIKSTASTNDKVKILKDVMKHLNINDSFFDLINTTYSPRVTLGLSRKTFKNNIEIDQHIVNFNLDALVSRITILRKNDRMVVQNKDQQETILQILDRGFDWGLSTKLINKAFKEVTGETKDLIYQPKYMRCSTLNEKALESIKFPAYSQMKADSEFTNIFIQGDYNHAQVYTESRNGKPQKLELFQSILSTKLNDIEGEKIVLNGELMSSLASTREENRGLISSLVQTERTLKTLDEKIENAKTDLARQKLRDERKKRISEWAATEESLYVYVWDFIPLVNYDRGVCEIPYHERLNMLSNFIEYNGLQKFLKVVPTVEVNSIEEATKHFNEMLEQGEEGTILKDKNAIWKDGTSKHQIKFKEFHEFEMRVTGYEISTSKAFKGGIGALIIESEDGLIKSRVGSGLTLEERGLERVDKNDSGKGLKVIDGFDFNQYNGMVVTIRATSLATSKTKDYYSLSLPTLEKFRYDKDVADDFNYIKNLFKR